MCRFWHVVVVASSIHHDMPKSTHQKKHYFQPYIWKYSKPSISAPINAFLHTQGCAEVVVFACTFGWLVLPSILACDVGQNRHAKNVVCVHVLHTGLYIALCIGLCAVRVRTLRFFHACCGSLFASIMSSWHEIFVWHDVLPISVLCWNMPKMRSFTCFLACMTEKTSFSMKLSKLFIFVMWFWCNVDALFDQFLNSTYVKVA